jgi:small-conductance mechanosensitive channel
VEAVMLVITVFYILRIITGSLAFFIQSWGRKKGESGNSKASRGIIFIANGIIWICGFLFLIDNFGFDITTIVAGLGIGGIAIAMASQTVLGDLFNYLAIYFDKPFEQGDFIVLDDKMGVVEYIGIRTTRLRTLGGEQLVCSNTDLTSARVHNYKRMRERRSVFNVGVVYNTPLSKLRSLPGAFRKIIESVPSTRFDRAHFSSFGASSLDFEIVYYIISVEYNEYMDIQQKINLAIFELFEKESVEFAFPTQTIILQPTEQIQLNHGGH